MDNTVLNKKLNYMRTIALIMVLMQHAFAHIPDTSLVFISKFTYSSNTVLFLFISGYLYELNKFRYYKNGVSKFIINKFRKLMIPYFFWNIILWLNIRILHMFSYSSNFLYKVSFHPISFYDAIKNAIMCVFPYVEHFWYVYILFFIFIICYFVRIKITIFYYFIVVLIYSVVSQKFSLPSLINRLVHAYPVFVFGQIASNYEVFEHNIKKNKFIVIVGVISFILTFIDYHYLGIVEGVFRKLENQILFCSSIVLWNIIIEELIKIPELDILVRYISDKSYIIYLIHNPYFVVSSTAFLVYFNIPTLTVLGLAVTIGMIGPILISNLVINRYRLLRFLMLGENH